MTDLEMTKLCAEAMDIPCRVSHDRMSGKFVEINTGRDPGNEGAYDPLNNDAQAMALVKKLRIMISTEVDGYGWLAELNNHGWISNNLNRAVVECVAKMQKAKHGN